jgi:hypothetical protein
MAMMNIGLFGDSFAFQKQNEPFPSWVDLLAQHYVIDNHSECGVGEYKILKQIQSADLDSYDIVIVSHTSYSRVFVEHNPLHSDSEYHRNCDILYADIEGNTDKFSLAGQLYYKHIYSDDYAQDIHNLILKEIDSLLVGRLAVHLTPFDHTDLYQFVNTVDLRDVFVDNRGLVNHFNPSGNQEVYRRVLDRLAQ